MKKATILSGLQDQPALITPMLATLIKEPFNDESYIYEVKWDGYRIVAFLHNGNVKLQSRGGEDYTKKYPSVVNSLKRLRVNAIIDGEVVYINREGKPDFDALQTVNGQTAPVVYYAFDLLSKDGMNLMTKPLLQRKAALKGLLEESGAVKLSDHFDDGLVLFQHVKAMGLEGIVAKRRDSPYLEGDRSKKWLKIVTDRRQEFVIGGWVESEKRNTFRTLLFGSYENGVLKWKGHAGGGFKEKDMPAILSRLKQIEIDYNPFDSDVEYSEGEPHWVKPELVANIKFSTVTKSGRIRKPAIFLGFRQDKPAREVVTERSQKPPIKRRLMPDTKFPEKTQGNSRVSERNPPTSPGSNWPQIEAEPIRNQETVRIEDCNITLHNVDRELWKGITKAELIQYYNSVAKYILPHVKNRSLSLHLKPKGPKLPGLYIKDMEGREPACAEVFSTPRKHKKVGKRDVIDYLVCNNTATLVYMINLGCVDINPWTSTVFNSLHPDFIVIDLDPSDDDFKKSIETARAAKEYFDQKRLEACVKTSGKTGMHLFIPCSSFTFSQARHVAENICEAIHQLVPSITTTTVTVADRGTNVYLDPNQNDYADTVACAYSVRPFKRPTVSTPIEWKELKGDLVPDMFTMQTIQDRLEKKGDLFLSTLDRNVAVKNDKFLKVFL